MRNLTITRRKSFVGCIMKDQVYIQDDSAPELTISGVPCRKLGDIKNGETKTFQVSDAQLQIFVIVDKASKDYCNAALTVPEGQEDVSYSGKHIYTFGSNPFRFDGVILTDEQLTAQKKQSRKGAVLTVIAVVIGLVIGVLVSGAFRSVSPKTFTKDAFRITLTDEFSAVGVNGFYAAYQSKSVLVFAQREDKSTLEEMSLAEYSALVCGLNNKPETDMQQGSDFCWFSFTETVDEEEIYYIAVCCESADAFWIVNFATPVANQEKYHNTFLEWAASISIN